MLAINQRGRVVRVKVEIGEGGWFYATSPDLKGLLVTEPSLDALYEAIPDAIVALYKARELDMVVTPIEEDNHHHRGWVATPAALAEQALSKLRGHPTAQ